MNIVDLEKCRVCPDCGGVFHKDFMTMVDGDLICYSCTQSRIRDTIYQEMEE
jgi:formylmethanofuran dehydrogenase subunit E